MNDRIWLLAAVIALVTAALRFLPFFVFSTQRNTPPLIKKLSASLPCAIMSMLVVYCLKDTDFASLSGWVPAIVGCAVATLSYLWKRNTLLSILLGTVCYMLITQNLF